MRFELTTSTLARLKPTPPSSPVARDESLATGRFDPQAETGQLAIPYDITLRSWLGRIDFPFRQFFYALLLGQGPNPSLVITWSSPKGETRGYTKKQNAMVFVIRQ